MQPSKLMKIGVLFFVIGLVFGVFIASYSAPIYDEYIFYVLAILSIITLGGIGLFIIGMVWWIVNRLRKRGREKESIG